MLKNDMQNYITLFCRNGSKMLELKLCLDVTALYFLFKSSPLIFRSSYQTNSMYKISLH